MTAGELGGLVAAIWLVLLWTAAPLLEAPHGGPTVAAPLARFADRLRNTMVLGTAIPFALGLAQALDGLACLAAGALLAALATLAHRGTRSPSGEPSPATTSRDAGEGLALALCVAVGAVTLTAFPQFVRPPLDGDTLAYHLPNALAWVHDHSLWTTGTRYWWYPGGSELFAAGLIAVGARWSVPLAGAVAALLLTLRVIAWGERAVPRALRGSRRAAAILGAAALVGGALLGTRVAAPQAGSLQNDLWLAAAMLEVLWVLLCVRSSRATITAVALCSLIKPSGFIVALIAVGAHGAARLLTRGFARGSASLFSERSIDVLGGLVVFGLWVARDVLLAPHAIVPISSTMVPSLWATTIAGHGEEGLRLLLFALWQAGLPAVVFAGLPFVCGLLLLVLAVDRREGDALSAAFAEEESELPTTSRVLGTVGNGARSADGGVSPHVTAASATAWISLTIAGVMASLFYLYEPFGYAGSVPQLATGASLRFDLPAMACGAALLALAAARAPFAVSLPALAGLVYGAAVWQGVFWNDAVTRITVPVALAMALLAWAGARFTWFGRRLATLGVVACAALFLVAGGGLAASRALQFYDASQARDASPVAGVYGALLRIHPAAVVTVDVRAGSVGMMLPQAAVYDGLDQDACAQARRLGAVLLVGRAVGVAPAVAARRRRSAVDDCGRVLYRDPSAVVMLPAAE